MDKMIEEERAKKLSNGTLQEIRDALVAWDPENLKHQETSGVTVVVTEEAEREPSRGRTR
jgi:hypothetical protein